MALQAEQKRPLWPLLARWPKLRTPARRSGGAGAITREPPTCEQNERLCIVPNVCTAGRCDRRLEHDARFGVWCSEDDAVTPTTPDAIAATLVALDRRAVPLAGRRAAAVAVAIVDDGR